MQDFRLYIKECMEGENLLPTIEGSSEAVNLLDADQREAINFILSDITDEVILDPVVAYERVRSVLLGIGYALPPVSARPELFDDTEGEEVFGMTRPQPFGSLEHEICYLYFAFLQTDESYDVLAEIVTEMELEDILSD
jgi:hypothetical protein